MDVTKPKIVFFGNERLATGVRTSVPTLLALIEAGYDVLAVVSNYERGTSRSNRDLEIQVVAEKHNIPLLLPENVNDIANQLASFRAEIAILVAYGRMVPDLIIDLFPKGIINIHPSLLPLHRGPTPIESVILSNEAKSGVTIMRLVKAMDAGPIYGQSELELKGNETKQELADILLKNGGDLLIKLLPSILDGSNSGIPQDDAVATYDRLIKKEDGRLDWNKPATQLEREVRAYAEWPKSSTILAGYEAVVTKVHVKETKTPLILGTVFLSEDKELAVQTSDGLMVIDRLKPAGKNEMSAHEYLNGYGKIYKK